jgi:hypothetical protein
VKTLVDDYNGGQTVLIRSSRPRFGRRQFDPWHVHAIGLTQIGYAYGISGLTYVNFRSQVHPHTGYFWFQENGQDLNSTLAIIASIQNFQVPNYPGNWIGEGFNKLLRSTCTEKVISSGLGNWTVTH